MFLGSPKFNSSDALVNSQLVCLLPVGIFNPVVFNLNYFFVTLMLGPTSTCAINTAEGKQRLFIFIFIIILIPRFYDLSEIALEGFQCWPE